MADRLTMAMIEQAIGGRFAPPPETTPATQALYARWVNDRCTASIPNYDVIVLIDQPGPVADLDRATYATRMAHGEDELRELAKQEMST